MINPGPVAGAFALLSAYELLQLTDSLLQGRVAGRARRDWPASIA